MRRFRNPTFCFKWVFVRSSMHIFDINDSFFLKPFCLWSVLYKYYHLKDAPQWLFCYQNLFSFCPPILQYFFPSSNRRNCHALIFLGWKRIVKLSLSSLVSRLLNGKKSLVKTSSMKLHLTASFRKFELPSSILYAFPVTWNVNRGSISIELKKEQKNTRKLILTVCEMESANFALKQVVADASWNNEIFLSMWDWQISKEKQSMVDSHYNSKKFLPLWCAAKWKHFAKPSK